MTLTAIVLVLASAGLHVVWNLLGKRHSPTPEFFLAANLTAAVLVLPALLWQGQRVPDVPLRTWVVLVGTGACQAAYFRALAGAYRSGELSFAYPLVRALPPALVLVGSVALGRAAELTPACAAGVVLIGVGGLLLAGYREARTSSTPSRATLAWIGVATLGTTGYTLLDDFGQRSLRELEVQPLTANEATVLYLGLEWGATVAWLALWTSLRRAERPRRLPPLAILFGAGLTIYLSYGLVLLAMAHVRDVSYVAGFRQVGIPLGALVGVLVLRERLSRRRALGVGLVTVGALMVAFAGRV